MWVRIRGLFIVLRDLTPVLAIVAVWLVTSLAIGVIEEAETQYRDSVDPVLMAMSDLSVLTLGGERLTVGPFTATVPVKSVRVPGITQLTEIAEEANALVTEVKDSVIRWATTIAITLVAIVFVSVVSRIETLLADFKRGGQMLTTGIDDRPDVMASLVERVTALEAQLAGRT